MNIKNITKIYFLYVVLSSLNSCTYYKAMNKEEQRRETINVDLGEEENKKSENEKERAILEAELSALNSEVSGLNREIEKVKEKIVQAEASNMKKAKQEFGNQLSILESRKGALQKDIDDLKNVIKEN